MAPGPVPASWVSRTTVGRDVKAGDWIEMFHGAVRELLSIFASSNAFLVDHWKQDTHLICYSHQYLAL
jgi:hypothetical protein